MVKVDPLVQAHLKAGVCWADSVLAIAASQIPRRLGSEATARELAKDKQFWKRASWLYRQLSEEWEMLSGMGLDRPILEKHVKNAKHTDQQKWYEMKVRLAQEDQDAATLKFMEQLQDLNSRKLLKRVIHLYQRELDGLARITAPRQ